MSFDKLNLKKEVLESLIINKFTEPTQVQRELIPRIVSGNNVVFTSRTGSGKTLAYTLGVISKLNKKLGLQMIVLVPTRELAIQVGKEITKIVNHLGLSVATLYGGRSVEGDYRTISKKNQILVGTPGRVIQHINIKSIKVGEVKHLVLDESDQMFDEGFMKDCAYIATRVSKDVQIILSSATITQKVKSFIEEEIVSYDQLFIGEQIPSTIKQETIFVLDKKQKEQTLIKYLKDFLKESSRKKILVFANTKMKVGELAKTLEEKKIRAQAIHSGVLQKERVNRLNLFKQGRLSVLVTTDVSARGIHIDDVDLVINFDVPTRLEFFVHRIGRTGRVGAQGAALTLVQPEDDERYKEIKEEFSLKAEEKKIS